MIGGFMAKKKAKDKRPKWFTDKLKQAIAEEKERDEEEREEDDETEELTEGSDLFDILGALCNGVALMRLAKSSLARDFVAGDEVATLEAALKIFRKVDVAINWIADGHVPEKTKTVKEKKDAKRKNK